MRRCQRPNLVSSACRFDPYRSLYFKRGACGFPFFCWGTVRSSIRWDGLFGDEAGIDTGFLKCIVTPLIAFEGGFGMIDPVTLLNYSLIVFGFVFIPGPATLFTIARATSSGARVGIATGVGIAAGDILHTLMAVIGISAIIATSAFLFSLIKYAGAAYLVYLGIRAIVAKAPIDLSDGALPVTAQDAFKQGILAEVLNPKTGLFFLAFLPQFVQPEQGLVALQLIVLGVVFVVLGLVSTVICALGSGHLGRFLRRNPMVMKWQGKVVGSIYCGLGLRLAFQDR